MALYRDFFVVVDHAVSGVFWSKKFLFDHACYERGLKQCLSQQEWMALYAGAPSERIAPIQAENIPWRAFRSA